MGTGLGLAIAQEIVEIHGGRIDATSEADVGTSFLINLPIHQPRERSLRATLRFWNDPPVPVEFAGAKPSGPARDPETDLQHDADSRAEAVASESPVA